MTDHTTGTREDWLAARLELAEKELTRRSDELARRRQELPWVRIDKEYRLETDEGTAFLADLFRGRSQLLVYDFMFGPEYTAGCPRARGSRTASSSTSRITTSRSARCRGLRSRNNLSGTYGATQAFLPLLTRSRGAIVNVLSLSSFAALPFVPAYSISKAGRVLPVAIAKRSFGQTGREGTCGPARPCGYRYVPRPGHTEGLSEVRCASYLRRSGERGGGRLPRPMSESMAESGAVKAVERQYAALVEAESPLSRDRGKPWTRKERGRL